MIGRIWHGYTTPENLTPENLLREEIFIGIRDRHIPDPRIQLPAGSFRWEVELIRSCGSPIGSARPCREDMKLPSPPAPCVEALDAPQHYEISRKLRPLDCKWSGELPRSNDFVV
jgi:hypothetical protein